MSNPNNELYVITGGPGVGKTTLVERLKQAGYSTVEEQARKIIKHQMNIGGNGLPWSDKALYAQLMFEASVKTYQEITLGNHATPIFFDRGILDTVCYMTVEKIPLSSELLMALEQVTYNKNVFILPPWREIYRTDKQRKQSWAEAVLTFHQMKNTYLQYGYNVIEVPKVSALERAHFILEHMKDLHNLK